MSGDTLNDLIARWKVNDKDAFNSLITLLYGELHRLAHQRLRRQQANQSLNTTALLHETYVRLAGRRPPAIKDRKHFFALAGTVMRNVLVDHARERLSAKRNAGIRLQLSPDIQAVDGRDVELLSLDEALNQLARLDARQTRIVEMRYFAGLSIEDTAEILGTSLATVKREWMTARAWLRNAMPRAARENRAPLSE